ncbi:MAG TPA: hypothetical protein PLV92_08775, partial [Pirellulaceae bacterium]|nr:hypothetical protein [Pirellulaceae bacterium]
SLIMAITCRDRDLARFDTQTKAAEDPGVWNGDVVELLLETQAHTYYQIAINPNGAVIDLDRKDGKLNTSWRSGVQTAVRRAADRWSIELRLPLAGEEQAVLNPLDGVAGRPPSRTYPWHFNVCRQRTGRHGTELSALSPTGADHFHKLERFAILNLKPGGMQQDNPSETPDHQDGYVLQRIAASKLFRAGRYAEAADLFVKLAADPKATALQQADASEQAIECLSRVKPRDGASLSAQERAQDQLKEQQREKAIDEIVASIKSPHHRMLAMMRRMDSQRRWPDILEKFGGEDFSKWPDTLVGYAATARGHAYFHAKRGTEAAADLQLAADWLTESNWRGEALLSLGRTYRQLTNERAKAIEAFRQVYTTGNEFKHCAAACEVAEILKAEGKLAEARAELERIDERKMTIESYRQLLQRTRDTLKKSESE